MTRALGIMMKRSMAVVLAVGAVAMVPGVAKADRGGDRDDRGHVNYYDRDHGRDHDDRDRGHDDDHRGGSGSVNIDIRSGGGYRPPVVVDRVERVWVEPVYQTVCDRVWVEPVYRTVGDRVWKEAVVERNVQKVWVPGHWEQHLGNRPGAAPVRVFVNAHYEDKCTDRVVSPAHWEDVQRQELVAPGHYQDVQRQEVVSAGHWEDRVVRVAQGPVRDDAGLRIDLKLPIRF